jgi:dTDP-4-amino-4,6-dideoxygalactose transaminase
MKLMSLHGLSGDAWNRYSARGHWYYEVMDFGFKYNMTDIAAALGLRQLDRMADFQRRREDIARRYNDAFGALDACAVPHDAGLGMHAWHLYILRVEPAALRVGRDEIIERLRERGVGTSVHFIPLNLHPAYQQRYGYRPGQLPNSEAAYDRAVSLPIYPAMTDDDVAHVIDAVSTTLAECRR